MRTGSVQAGDTVRYPYRIGLRGRAADAAVASAVPPFASAYAAHPVVGVRNGEAPRNAWQNRRYRFLSDVGEKNEDIPDVACGTDSGTSVCGSCAAFRLRGRRAGGASSMNTLARSPVERAPMGRPAAISLAVSVLFYLVAMVTTPFSTGGPPSQPWADGWEVLLTGWLGVLGGIYAWLANPLVFFAWAATLRRSRTPAVVAAVLALLFGITFLSLRRIAVNEAGDVQPVHLDAVGYWCWLASFGFALVAAVLLPGRAKPNGAG